MLVADFADDFFDQIFDRNQAGDTAVFIHHDGHANVTALHLAQQVADQFAFGDKVDVATHQGVDGTGVGFGVGDLKNVLSMKNALYVVDGAFVNRDPRIGLGLQQIDHLFDGGVNRDGDHLGARL